MIFPGFSFFLIVINGLFTGKNIKLANLRTKTSISFINMHYQLFAPNSYPFNCVIFFVKSSSVTFILNRMNRIILFIQNLPILRISVWTIIGSHYRILLYKNGFFEVKFKPTLDKVTQKCIRDLNDEKFLGRKLEMIEENEWKEYRKVIYFEFGNTY